MKSVGVIETLEDLYKIADGIRFGRIHYSYSEFYRGQACETYTLKPNIARSINSSDSLVHVEKAVINEFRERIKSEGLEDYIMLSSDTRRNEWEWIAQAQHYRLPTRFLDWTIKPEMALFFAVENQSHYNSDGQFWIFLCPPELFKTDGDEEEFFSHSPYVSQQTIFLNPCFFWDEGKHSSQLAESRRSGQWGRFSVSSHEKSLIPMEEDVDMRKYLQKYVVPKEAKPALRNYLMDLSYSNENIYIEGNATINHIITEIRNKYAI